MFLEPSGRILGVRKKSQCAFPESFEIFRGGCFGWSQTYFWRLSKTQCEIFFWERLSSHVHHVVRVERLVVLFKPSQQIL